MDKDLNQLHPEEITRLKDAFAQITILIAGADGNIDPAELSWAEKIAEIRTFTGDERLHVFHEAVNAEIARRIRDMIAALPGDTASRNAGLSAELSQLNPILEKLDPQIAAYLYKGYVTFAERIAKASGGVLSFFTIGAEEKKWIGLPMLKPFIYEGEAATDEEE
jgi:hypothetical protein